MTEFKPIGRRQFLKLSTLALGGTVLATTIAARTSFAQQAKPPKLRATVGQNHGHAFTINLEALFKNGPKVYEIKGASSHGHKLNITQAILATLEKTKVVDVEAQLGVGHSHFVRLQII